MNINSVISHTKYIIFDPISSSLDLTNNIVGTLIILWVLLFFHIFCFLFSCALSLLFFILSYPLFFLFFFTFFGFSRYLFLKTSTLCFLLLSFFKNNKSRRWFWNDRRLIYYDFWMDMRNGMLSWLASFHLWIWLSRLDKIGIYFCCKRPHHFVVFGRVVSASHYVFYLPE